VKLSSGLSRMWEFLSTTVTLQVPCISTQATVEPVLINACKHTWPTLAHLCIPCWCQQAVV